MINFLDRIDDNYVLAQSEGFIKGSKQNPEYLKLLREQGAASFKINIETSFSLFSKSENILKHIVLITAGPDFTNEGPEAEIIHNYTEPEWMDGVTIKTYGRGITERHKYWPGVPLYQIMQDHSFTTIRRKYNNIDLPALFPVNFSAVFKNQTTSYKYEITGRQNTFGDLIPIFFSASRHSKTSWTTDVEWQATNEYGETIASYTESPETFIRQNDTATVKLFAASEISFSEVYEQKNFGPIYGIVDENFSLLALEQDKVEQQLSEILKEEGGVPYLNNDEIFIPLPVEPDAVAIIKDNIKDNIIAIVPSNTDHNIRITFRNPIKNIKSIKIYSLKGHVVKEWNRQNITGKREIIWDLTDNHGNIVSNGLYLITLVSDKQVVTKEVIVMNK